MTGQDPDTTHQAEAERVARLLAAAAGPTAVPDDVAARLDETLSGLVAERAAAQGSPAGEPHDEGRVVAFPHRRRRWPALLVAAAAVSVVGLGVGNVLGPTAGEHSAVESAVDDGAAGGAAAPAQTPGQTPAQTPGQELDGRSGTTADRATPEPQALARDVRAVRLRSTSLRPDAQRAEDFALTAPAPTPRLDRRCVDTATSRGDSWARARLDGRPAVLVLRAPAGGRRTVEVFTCDDPGTPAATAQVDAR